MGVENGQNQGGEQRGQPRKPANMPVAIGQLLSPVEVLGNQIVQTRPIRRKPEHVMKVALFFQAIDEGEILNISSTGLALFTKTNLSAGKKIAISFLVKDELTGEQNPIFAKCVVRWSRQHDNRGNIVGLEFVLMDHEDARSLSDFIARLPEAPN